MIKGKNVPPKILFALNEIESKKMKISLFFNKIL